MKNNKVLITLGCSFTEGVGCYDYTGLSKKELDKLKELSFDSNFYGKNLDNFLYGSWGSQLQEMIGASTFYNFGKGGDSNSGQSKTFYDQIDKINLEGKEVLVVWLMTYPHRFSFYNEGIAQTIPFNMGETNSEFKNTTKMVEGYVSYVEKNWDFNTGCEQFYYLRTVAEICKNRNFKFAWANVQQHQSLTVIYPLLDSYLKNTLLKNEIFGYNFIEGLLTNQNKELLSKICGHPNKKGYTQVAKRFASPIMKLYPDFCKDKLFEKYNDESIEYEKIAMNREEFPLPNHENDENPKYMLP